MSPIEIFTYAIALGIAVVIPGPGIAALVGKALGGGLRPSLYFIVGIALGDVVYLTLAVLGLAALAHAFSGVFTVVKFAGAAYLLWLAWKFWHAGISPEKLKASKGNGFLSSVLGGFAVTMGNPKAIVFYLALLPSVVNLKSVTPQSYFLLIAMTFLILNLVLLPYAVLASRARGFLTNPKALRVLNRTAAAAISGAAAFIMLRG